MSVIALLEGIHAKLDARPPCECAALRRELAEMKQMLANALHLSPPPASPAATNKPLCAVASKIDAVSGLRKSREGYFQNPNEEGAAMDKVLLKTALEELTGGKNEEEVRVKNWHVEGAIVDFLVTGESVLRDVLDSTAGLLRGRYIGKNISAVHSLHFLTIEMARQFVQMDWMKSHPELKQYEPKDVVRWFPHVSNFEAGRTRDIRISSIPPTILLDQNLRAILTTGMEYGRIDVDGADLVVRCQEISHADLIASLLRDVTIQGARLTVNNE